MSDEIEPGWFWLCRKDGEFVGIYDSLAAVRKAYLEFYPEVVLRVDPDDENGDVCARNVPSPLPEKAATSGHKHFLPWEYVRVATIDRVPLNTVIDPDQLTREVE